jgi:hypothetical protein
MNYRKPGTLHGRFPEVARDSGPVLYVSEFSNGVVKVGMTTMARERLSGTLTQARRYFGKVDVVRFHASARFAHRQTALAAEREALYTVRLIGQRATDQCSEFFTGIPFAEAVRIVDEAVEAELA